MDFPSTPDLDPADLNSAEQKYFLVLDIELHLKIAIILLGSSAAR
jgi:hypothetical protein